MDEFMPFEVALLRMRQGAKVKRKSYLVSYYISLGEIVEIRPDGSHVVTDYPFSGSDIVARDWEVVEYGEVEG